MSLIVTFIVSCSKDDDIPSEPADTITLNMLNEQNGKTFLGTSDVYINKSNNFYMSSSYISDAGAVSGIGVKINPMLSNLTREAAVIPGHAYQVFNKSTLLDFPSGNRAVQKGTGYYQVYVVSQIVSENITTGAIIKYFLAYPDGTDLPDFDHKLGDFYNMGETLEMALPKGAECVMKEKPYESVEDIFIVSTERGKLSITLNEVPSQVSGPYGTYTIYIRLNNVYTSVVVNVKA